MKDRVSIIKHHLNNGGTYLSAGQELGVSGERARKIFADSGETIEARPAQRRRNSDIEYLATLGELAFETYKEHGVLADAAKALQVSPDSLREYLESIHCEWKHWTRRSGPNSQFSHLDCVNALQRVAKHINKPSVGNSVYDRYSVRGEPSSGTIIARFHSWNGALRAAGLEEGMLKRDFKKRWSNTDIIEAVSQCATSLGKLPAAHEYETWAFERDVPSLSLIKQRYGWKGALTQVLSESSVSLS
jgi:hypothetical protein